jgi:hypothetical protein
MKPWNLPEDSVSIDASVLKVDSRRAVGAHDDLQLVVPTVRTSPDLHAAIELVGTTQKVSTELCQIAWRGIIQTHDKQRIIHDLKAGRVIMVG